MTDPSLQNKADLSPILSDQPAKDDFLDFDSYVQALYDSVVDDDTTTPLTLGIFGRWGTGKTTLMGMLESKLTERGAITIWFNAWQYSKEDELWAAFLQSLINKVQGKLGFFQRWIFSSSLLLRRIHWRDIPGALIEFLARAIIIILPLLLINPLTGTLQQAGQAIAQFGGRIVAGGLAVWLVVKPLLEAIQENITIDFSNFKQESDYQKHIAFLDKFREHFADIVASLPHANDKRLVVFIDDLDRCPSERILQVLDAVKLFVDIPGCVFVLGLDADIVQQAVKSKYNSDPLAQKEYLGKIVQLPFRLPPLARRHMENLLVGLQLDLPDSRCSQIFVVGLNANPRELKRAINIFSLLWNLVQARQELLVNIKPVRLAKVVVIQHGYPELHRLLQQRPDLLVELERYFRQEQEYASSIAKYPKKGLTEQRSEQYITSQLLQIITEQFNEEELRNLCFYLEVDYENLAATGKAGKARELILYLERQGRIPDLISEIQRIRPHSLPNDIIPKGTLMSVNDESFTPPSKPEILEPFIENDRLRRMMLLNDPSKVNDVCNFIPLDPADIEEYFTLTSRTETPSVEDSESVPA